MSIPYTQEFQSGQVISIAAPFPGTTHSTPPIHPWLIVGDEGDALEVIPASTLACAYEGKNREWRLNHDPYAYQIPTYQQHPPFDSPNKRTVYVNLSGLTTVPKVSIYQMQEARMWSNGQPLNQKTLNRIQNWVYGDMWHEPYDPFDYSNQDKDWSVDHFVQQQVQNKRETRMKSCADLNARIQNNAQIKDNEMSY